jgi:hypothetical protein
MDLIVFVGNGAAFIFITIHAGYKSAAKKTCPDVF